MNNVLMAVVVAMTLSMAGAGYAGPAVYFFESGTEGWTTPGESGGIGNFRAEGGALVFDYVENTGANFDPILISPTGLSVNAARHHWLRFDIEIIAQPEAGPQNIQIFFNDGPDDGYPGYNEPDSRTFFVEPNAGLQSIIFDMTPIQPGRDAFDGTVTQFRIDPGRVKADLVGGSARIEVIALTDDADFDGINDDRELEIFGDLDTADYSSDYDGDGIPDRIEIADGLDPLVDEGISMPVGGTSLLLLALGLTGYRVLRRKKS